MAEAGDGAVITADAAGARARCSPTRPRRSRSQSWSPRRPRRRRRRRRPRSPCPLTPAATTYDRHRRSSPSRRGRGAADAGRRAAPPSDEPLLESRTMMLGGLGAVGLGLAGPADRLLGARPSEPRDARARIVAYGTASGVDGAPQPGSGHAPRRVAGPGHGRRREDARRGNAGLEDRIWPAARGSRQPRSSRPSGCCCTRASSSSAAWSGCCSAAAASSSASSSLARSALVLPWLCLGSSASRGASRPSTPRCADTLQLMAGSLCGRSLAGPVGRHRRARGHRADRRRVQARAGRDAPRRRRSRTPSRASPSGCRARTSTGS